MRCFAKISLSTNSHCFWILRILYFLLIDVSIPVVIHGFDFVLIYFLVICFIGACLSSKEFVIVRRLSKDGSHHYCYSQGLYSSLSFAVLP